MDNRIGIAFFITDFSRDGAQRQLLELAKNLDKNKFQIYVLPLVSGGSMENAFRQVPGLQIFPLRKKGKFDLLCLYRSYRALHPLNAAVVQPFLTPATFFGLLPALWCRTPLIIVTERNSGDRKDLGWGSQLYVRMENLFSRFADWAVANSEAGRTALLKAGLNPQRLKVIYNGLNFQRLHTDSNTLEQARLDSGIPPGSQVVGMMARFFPIKNHAGFFKAARMVNESLPSVHFGLLGDGPLRQTMENYCADLGLRSQTVFWGEQPAVGAYLSLLDVVVLTSSAEGCSNSILEAMSLGKPVVATDVGGNREIITSGENGFLVPPGDIRAMADQILWLLQNPVEARTIGQKAREFVLSHFSPEKMVHEYALLYETTLRQKQISLLPRQVRHER